MDENNVHKIPIFLNTFLEGHASKDSDEEGQTSRDQTRDTSTKGKNDSKLRDHEKDQKECEPQTPIFLDHRVPKGRSFPNPGDMLRVYMEEGCAALCVDKQEGMDCLANRRQGRASNVQESERQQKNKQEEDDSVQASEGYSTANHLEVSEGHEQVQNNLNRESENYAKIERASDVPEPMQETRDPGEEHGDSQMVQVNLEQDGKYYSADDPRPVIESGEQGQTNPTLEGELTQQMAEGNPGQHDKGSMQNNPNQRKKQKNTQRTKQAQREWDDSKQVQQQGCENYEKVLNISDQEHAQIELDTQVKQESEHNEQVEELTQMIQADQRTDYVSVAAMIQRNPSLRASFGSVMPLFLDELKGSARATIEAAKDREQKEQKELLTLQGLNVRASTCTAYPSRRSAGADLMREIEDRLAQVSTRLQEATEQNTKAVQRLLICTRLVQAVHDGDVPLTTELAQKWHDR